ncbi:carboxylic ester hydrolase [Parastagonospora nodorum]|nr:carboxylic ester hydrolase [Parastagonospora nodorum]
MSAMIRLLSLSLPLLSVVTAAVSPQSVGSDLSIVTHNDLYGNDTTRNAAVVALRTQCSYSSAASRCAALGTSLWNPDGLQQDLGFLRFLAHDKNSDNAGTFWVGGNSTAACRAINVDGTITSTACSIALPALCSNTVNGTASQVTVTTNNATITGIRQSKAFRFLGLNYATIPARFAQSVYLPPAPNTSALEYGPTCIQLNCKTCSEDCLSLNIWTPYLPNGKVAAHKKKAVMVWIYGGGFTSGAASDTTFDGSALASRGDVVAVTINYRLGTLGALSVENTTVTGNQGIRDQSTALDWIRAHIEDFGGDKDRITIFGQSAGSASVRALLASPQASKKVAGAIMQSSPLLATGSDTGYATYKPMSAYANQTMAIISESGCTNASDVIDCLRKIDALTLYSQKTFVRFPVADGTFLPNSGLSLSSTGPKLSIPILAGLMHDDGSNFITYPTSLNLTAVYAAASLPVSTVIDNPSVFPIPYNALTTQNLFNLTSRVSTDRIFRCLAQSTAHVAAKNNVFKKIYAYEFDRAYQIAGYSPNPPACEAPVTPAHPFGDPTLPFYKCHSGELYAVFGTTISQGEVPRDQNDISFSQYIVDSWSAFARTGDPTPAKDYLSARGFTNTTMFVAKAGTWDPVGASNAKPVRVLDLNIRNEAWRELQQCETLGTGLEYYAN